MSIDTTRRGSGPEAIVALACPVSAIPAVTRYRSTLITASLQTLKERDLLETYQSRLDPEHREVIRATIAGVWVMPDLILSHYRACEALRLTPAQQLDIGRSVGAKVQGTLLGTLASMATQTGASPWTFLGQFNRLFERLAMGGGVEVLRVGPKEALVEIYRVPVFQIPYFATAWRGMMQGLCELFCTKTYVKSGRLEGEAKASYAISWA